MLRRMAPITGIVFATALSISPILAAEEPQYSGFLEDYSGLVENPDSNLIYNYVYQKPDAELTGYTKFLIDAITLFPHPEADFKGINANDLTLLQKHFHEAMTKALSADGSYQIVEEPGPGVMRIRVAITDLVPVRPAMNTLTTWVPQMRIVSGVIGAATDSNFFVGQIGMEAEFLDAESHDRLAMLVSKQAGKKYVPFSGRTADTTSKWAQIEQAMAYWAKKLRTRVDEIQTKAPAAPAATSSAPAPATDEQAAADSGQ